MTISRLLSNRPVVFPVGHTLDSGGKPFVLNEHSLSTHLAVLGGSGSGKSKFLELLCRILMDNYRGFCFIDPHGDTSEDLLAYAARQTETCGSDAICKRIHYLEPSFETVFGFDPFEFRPAQSIPDHLRENAYHAWLHTKADKIAEIVQRKQGQSDFQGMARLQRILRDVLIAIGTPVTAAGKHLPLSDVLVLLDTHHRKHKEVMDLVFDHLPAEVRGDFASLRSYRSEDQRKKETESTINRLRSLLSPIVKAIFSSSAKTIDFRQIINNRGVVLVNLRKTDFFSADQRNAIGGMLIHEVLSTAETTTRQNRAPFYLIVDEARLFIGQDLMEGLDEARKFKLSVCLAGQHLGQFKTEEFDMTPSILNNCGTILCFQQKHPEDLDTWKKFFGYANLNFEKHFQIMDRQYGYDFLDVEDSSESHTKGQSRNTGGSFTETDGISHTDTNSVAYQTGRSETQSRQTARGESRSSSEGETNSLGSSHQWSPSGPSGFRGSLGDNESAGFSSQNTQGSSFSKSEGQSEGQTESQTLSRGASDGNSHSDARGASWGDGSSESDGITINHKKVPVPHLEEELHETPHLKNSVQDQLDRFAQLQRILPRRFAMVSLAGQCESFVVRIGDVNPMYPDAKDMAMRLAAMKHKIYALHPYYSTPGLSPEEQDRRLEEFLASVADTTAPPGGNDASSHGGKESGFVL